jgi:Domain of unknown function (DUF6443)
MSIKSLFVAVFYCIAFQFGILGQGPRPVPVDYPSNVTTSFVRTWTATTPQNLPNALNTGSIRQVKQSTQYVDALGRPFQSVTKQGSLVSNSAPVDLVSMVEYDAFGREQFKYLPTPSTANDASKSDGSFKLNPFTQQASFMAGQFGSQNETFFYSQTVFETSPQNRVVENATQGNSWVGTMSNSSSIARKSNKIKYFLNTVADSVRLWNMVAGSDIFGSYATTAIYSPGALYKNIYVDEDNKEVVEFKDKTGNLVLKKTQLSSSDFNGSGSGHVGWLNTYYIYDELNNLRAVIQPTGVELLLVTGWSLSGDAAILLQEQFFRYVYDGRNRLIGKKVPGAAEAYSFYDARDRLVMTQDGNLRALRKWMVMVYDALNRPTNTYLIADEANYNNPAFHLLAADVSSSYPNISQYPSELLTSTGYDEYGGFASYANLDITPFSSYLVGNYNASPEYAQPLQKSNQTKGLVTWTQTKVLGTALYVSSINIYDEKARVIQVKTLNASGGVDTITTQYNWAGQPIVTVEARVKGGINTQKNTIVTHYVYDDLNRLSLVEKKVSNSRVNGGAMPTTYKTILANEYDALGQVKRKSLGTKPVSGGPLAKLDMEYNIRGWLLSVNKSFINAANNTADQYFGMELGYDKNPQLGSFVPKYNGNISGTLWKSTGDQQRRKLDFSYDAVNRLTLSDFNQYVSGTGAGAIFNKSANIDFSEGNLTYDANGNILSLARTGLKITSSPVIDNLSYTYPNSSGYSYSNKLLKVKDALVDPDNGKLGDFTDGASGDTDDYVYDVNGNLISDKNKGITSITYNHLNLPVTITVSGKGTISYTYDAAGTKLAKQVVEPGKPTTTTTYLDNAVYLNDTLQLISHEEGRIRFKPTPGTATGSLQYDYFLKDHLGNVRMVLTEEVQQDIYPAATLEGSVTNANTAAGFEKNYYLINSANIVLNNSVFNISAYANNNGIANPYPSGNSGNTNVNANSANIYKLMCSQKAITRLPIRLK